MTDAEIKTCPRCGLSFRCMANLVERCDCALVDLAPSTLHDIRALYDDCLCVACLHALNAYAEVTDSPRLDGEGDA